MSDPQLPPPDPDEIERDDDTLPAGHPAGADSSVSAGAAVAGEGPALLTPPVPSPPPEQTDDDSVDDGEKDDS